MSMPAVVLPTFESCIRLPCNVQGRDFVVGDVHGHFDLIESLMQQVRFDPACDRLCAVGDLVDRGPQSHTVMEWLNQPWFFSVRGNHEQMVLDHDLGTGEADKHRRNGGAWFHDADLAVRKAIALALQRLPYVLEIERPNGCIGIVHAGPYESSGQEMTRLADMALYDAKARGRNTYAFFHASMEEAARHRNELIADFHGAVDRGEFELHFQPLVGAASGALTGAPHNSSSTAWPQKGT